MSYHKVNLLGGEGGGTSQKLKKKGGGGGGLAGSQFLKRVAVNDEGDIFQFFRECYSFCIKIKLKSEIFNDKRSL